MRFMEINRSKELLLKIYVCTCIAAISVSHMRGRSTVPIGTNGTGTHKRKANLSGDLLLCGVWVDHTQSSESRSDLAASRVSRGVISLLWQCCGRWPASPTKGCPSCSHPAIPWSNLTSIHCIYPASQDDVGGISRRDGPRAAL